MKRRIALITTLILVSLSCNLTDTTATQSIVQPPLINVETSVAQTLAFDHAVQTAVAANQPPPTVEIQAPPALPPAATVEPTSSTAMISASVDTNCRKGPATIYEAVSYLLVGKTSEVVNKYQNGLWWVIKDPNNPNQRCWVWGQTTTVTGNWQQLPEATQPHTPTVQLAMTLDGNVAPANYWGACPVNFVFTWTVTSNLPVTMSYTVQSNRSPFSALFIVSFGPGTKTFNYTIPISSSGSYWDKFIISAPLELNKKIDFIVNCI